MIDYVLALTIVDRANGRLLYRRSRTVGVVALDAVDDCALFDELAAGVREGLAPGASTVMELDALRTAVVDSAPADDVP